MTAPVVHEPAKIWGSSKGRTVTCDCGATLGPSWETVTDLMAAHIAAASKRPAA